MRLLNVQTPAGLAFYHTKLYLARVSEMALVELCGKALDIPRDKKIIGDRGFANIAHLLMRWNACITPGFLKGRSCFASDEVQQDYVYCRLRYSNEVGFSRLTDESALKDRVAYSFFPILQHIADWGCANINIGKPLQV